MADTVKRTVAGVFVQYRSVETDLLGNDVVVLNTADRGDEIELPAQEAQRLESFGMLAPEGTSRDEVVASVVSKADSIHAAMARALNPADNVLAVSALPTAPPSVSPPTGGAAPTGDFVTGDTGGPDAPPVNDLGDVSEQPATDLRVDAPDTSDTAALAAFIRDEGLTVPQTVALAEGDPERAAQVLEAERTATDGEPRAGVTKSLEPLAAQSGE